jgi:phenylalanyl-tRNA synthetase beta subunit
MTVNHKERLLKQFIEARPLGVNIAEDNEDFEQELEVMELEGVDLSQETVRSILKRMGMGLRG